MKTKKDIIEKLMNIILIELNNLDKQNELSLDEKLTQGQVLYNTYKILKNYDELEPLLQSYFIKAAKRRKWQDEEEK